MTNVSIRKMKVFLAALQHKSFTKASVAMNISQPATTTIVNQIEEEFQCHLFERTGATRRAIPSQEGLKVAETFSRIVANYDGELAGISSMSFGGSRQRRILIQTSYDMFIDKTWLADLVGHYSKDNLSIEILSREEIVDEIANRKATLGLIDGNVDHQHLDYAPLGVLELLVAVPNHMVPLFGNSKHLNWHELGKDVVLFSNINPALKRQVHAKVRSGGPDAPKLTSSDSSAAMLSLLQSGERIAIIPDAMRNLFQAGCDCTFYKFRDVSFSGQFGLVTPWGKLNRLPGEITRTKNCFARCTH